MSTASSPIDWRRAEQVAVRVASRAAQHQVLVDAGWLREQSQVAEDRIETTTGLRSTNGAPDVQIVDRDAWIRANIATFQHILQPLLDRWPSATASGRTGQVSSQVAGAEVGLLLGWMSTRVLGQFDVLFQDQADTSVDGEAVYLVGPNLGGLEERYGFDADQFRTWVLLHELTHRAQFTGVPWMRAYFTGLVEESLGNVAPDPSAFVGALRAALHDRTGAKLRLREGGVVGLLANDEQQVVLDRVGGLMSLLEGHGDVTMDRAGPGLVTDAVRFGRVLRDRRRRANPVVKLVQRLTGLEGKLAQYAAGERFISQVEAVGGERVIDRCWSSPDALPTMVEIREPRLWLERVATPVG